MRRNIFLFLGCVAFNLIIGNIFLMMLLMDSSIIYWLLISFFIIVIYGVVFLYLNSKDLKPSKVKIVLISVMASLATMLMACILISIALRLSIDNILVAALKGIVPLFVIAVVIASPIWIFVAFCNFLLMNWLQYPSKKIDLQIAK